ncbi:transcription termination factor 4, mitochondrial isoform X1 [Balaenoptera ricei]|uniref:transcription termination factor 4, mitochondrial isoform X1 n=1 Tax=Balaenoptera ricei TaxID=2746895 RepID=UPI0028BECF79|nr:transcription termination factor 4, mitochondrial isoform X1 [Balaenoptera ricei]XP_059785120.1 transcription termination factor 4, mitochondrial isoform X1 [Balaenoptera ricei]XP_059785122.1 transcription termination factor 4, mitochondrial isoform X1 [Balaenoptera ricei]
MAALGWQVSAWHRLMPLTWSLTAGRSAQLGEQRRTTALLLRKLTTVSSGGGLGEPPFVEPQKCAQEPEHRTGLTQCLLEKQRTAVERGKIVSSLLDMGFSDVHVNELLSIQPGTHPQQLLDIISELILLGLNPEPVCVAFKRSPQLLKLPIMQMKKRSSYLRKLGLGEGKLKRVLYCCPEIFTMRQRDIEIIVGVLKEKCLFTVKQVTEILHRCPCVLREDPGELEYKFQPSCRCRDHSVLPSLVRQVSPSAFGQFSSLCLRSLQSFLQLRFLTTLCLQYAYFRMGINHVDVVKTDFLQYSMTKTKERHMFLERLGRYQTPDKKGQTLVPNPLLKDILRVSEAEFLAKTACSSAEEFEVFKKLLAREEEESEGRMADVESLEEEEEEEEPEEGEEREP